MQLRKWNELPKFMRTREVRKYYNIVNKRRASLMVDVYKRQEMENHFECLWDLFRSIPSLEKPGASVLDEYYWLNKHDPNYSLCKMCIRDRDI